MTLNRKTLSNGYNAVRNSKLKKSANLVRIVMLSSSKAISRVKNIKIVVRSIVVNVLIILPVTLKLCTLTPLTKNIRPVVKRTLKRMVVPRRLSALLKSTQMSIIPYMSGVVIRILMLILNFVVRIFLVLLNVMKTMKSLKSSTIRKDMSL